jgi:S1-C subfamily serine protease
VEARLHVLTGGRTGLVWPLPGSTMLIGRGADADLRLSPEDDRAASARHATIALTDGTWRVRDLDSRNGTYVNGRRIREEAELADGDRIAFGVGGPLVEFRLAAPAQLGPEPPTATRGAYSAPAEEQTSPSQRIRRQVARGTARLRLTVLGLAGLLVLLVLGFTYATWLSQRERAAWADERAALLDQIDWAQHQTDRAVEAMEGERQELEAALERSQQQLTTLRSELARAEARGDQAEVAELRRELQNVGAALERQQVAAAVDFRGAEMRNWRAVAMIFSESADGVVSTGTAFAIRPDGTMLTARHVVLDARQRPGRRLAIQFAGSTQVWPARLLVASADADLAVVKVDQIVGDVPTVQGLNSRADTLAVGTPVALLGFPLGGRTARPGRTAAVPLLTAGVISDRRADRLELQGYGATGASGSPVLDPRGEVIGVIYGGNADESTRTVLAVPTSLVIELLRSVPIQ